MKRKKEEKTNRVRTGEKNQDSKQELLPSNTLFRDIDIQCLHFSHSVPSTLWELKGTQDMITDRTFLPYYFYFIIKE